MIPVRKAATRWKRAAKRTGKILPIASLFGSESRNIQKCLHKRIQRCERSLVLIECAYVTQQPRKGSIRRVRGR